MSLEEGLFFVCLGGLVGWAAFINDTRQASPYPGRIEKCFTDDQGDSWCYTTDKCWYDDMGQEVCTIILAKKEEK